MNYPVWIVFGRDVTQKLSDQKLVCVSLHVKCVCTYYSSKQTNGLKSRILPRCRSTATPLAAHTVAAGLLLSAVPAGDIDRQRRLPGGQQQRRRITAHGSKLLSAGSTCEQCHADSGRTGS